MPCFPSPTLPYAAALLSGDLGWRAPGGVPGSSMAGHIVLTGGWCDSLTGFGQLCSL
jgi:hypothetical protein